MMSGRIRSQEGADGIKEMGLDWVPFGACHLDIELRTLAPCKVEWPTTLDIDQLPQARITVCYGLSRYQAVGVAENAFTKMFAAAHIKPVAVIEMAKIQ